MWGHCLRGTDGSEGMPRPAYVPRLGCKGRAPSTQSEKVPGGGGNGGVHYHSLGARMAVRSSRPDNFQTTQRENGESSIWPKQRFLVGKRKREKNRNSEKKLRKSRWETSEGKDGKDSESQTVDDGILKVRRAAKLAETRIVQRRAERERRLERMDVFSKKGSNSKGEKTSSTEMSWLGVVLSASGKMWEWKRTSRGKCRGKKGLEEILPPSI